jgi:hypothetical protein
VGSDPGDSAAELRLVKLDDPQLQEAESSTADDRSGVLRNRGERKRTDVNHQEDRWLKTNSSPPPKWAIMFPVNPKAVTRWARAGMISAVRTSGGHRRIRSSEIRQLLEEVQDIEA